MRLKALLCLVLITVTLAVFMQTGNHQFVSIDDSPYVTDNPHVIGGMTGENIVWAFTATRESNWHPLTWLSHMADCQLYGLNPRGHHLTNVFIHTTSALLLFLFLVQVTGAPWRSIFVALLFALHPLHVESVAWVAERKDVLSCFFWMLTLLLYSRYVKRPGYGLYLLTLFSFVAGLMAKPMLVTLPVVLLLLDYWPFNRFRREQVPRGVSSPLPTLMKEKIPYFVLALLSAFITIYAQKSGGALNSLVAVPLGLRIENALVAYAKYIGKTIWPHDLAILYPLPPSLPLWQVLGSLLLLASASILTYLLRRRFPYLLVGWLWFLITLVPVIGLVQVGSQSMADRYTYIPLTGLFIMVAWGIPEVTKGWRYRKHILAISAGMVISVLTAVTWVQLGYWQNSILLYRHTLKVTNGNFLIHNNLGFALASTGAHDEAIKEYQEALRLKPDAVKTHYNLGTELAAKGRLDEAIIHYQQVLQLKPDFVAAYNSLAISYAQQGKLNEAIANFNKALQIDPGLVATHFNLGVALAKQNRTEEAAYQFSEVLRLRPDEEAARHWLEVLKGRR